MKQYKFLTRFLISAFVLYLAWFFLYENWLKTSGFPDQQLTQLTAVASKFTLQGMGYDLSITHLSHKSILYLGSERLLGIAHECNALVLFVLFAGFIISFPGRWTQKLWFIPAGMVAVWLVNVGRVSALTLTQIHYPSTLDFNHKYTFTLLVYGFIFGLWMLWVKKFGGQAFEAVKATEIKEEELRFEKEEA